MNIRSMTGFARVRHSTPHGELTVSLKSVNHRGLDLHFYAGAEFDPFENAMRTLLKQHIARGHVDVRLTWTPEHPAPSFTVNRPALDAYFATYKAIAEEHGIAASPDLTTILRLPGMLAESASANVPPDLESSALAALSASIAELNTFRDREGASLGDNIRSRAKALSESATHMERIRERVLPALHSRLQERLQDLLRGVNLDPHRVTQEAAILADRSDIGEEITRLQIHAAQVEEVLRAGGEVGKKLDFLCQELNREANTILSKTNGTGESGLGMTDLALAAKSDIEKIREQALNLE